MAWVAVEKDNSEWIFRDKPVRETEIWMNKTCAVGMVQIPIGTIEKIIGKQITWDDEAHEIEEEEK